MYWTFWNLKCTDTILPIYEFLTNFHCFFQSDWVRLSVACKKQLKYPSCSSYCLYYNVTVWRAINCFTIRIYSFIRNVLSWFPCYRVIPYNKGHLLSLVSMSAITWQILSWVTMHWTVCAKKKRIITTSHRTFFLSLKRYLLYFQDFFWISKAVIFIKNEQL